MFLAIRAFGWTPQEVAATDYGLLRALLMMNNEFEHWSAERAKQEAKRRR